PQPRKKRAEQNDVDGIDRLKQRRLHALPVDESVRIKIEAAARLFEQPPEDRVEGDQEQDSEDAVAGVFLQLERRVEYVAEQGDARNEQQILDDRLILHQRPDDG